MTELNDTELLAQYAGAESETAFAALVARHVNLVYSAALRFAGNPHHAEEITQAVFIILARKAGRLGRGVVLSGWLYQTARLTAANYVKGEIRRQRREQEAYMQSTVDGPDAAAWQQIAPLLDEAMGRLGERDRNAIVLRYFENKSAPEVAAALKVNEAAAHKRVSRAVDKLRKFFTKRGVTLTAAVIAGAVAANSVQAAPAGVAAAVAAAGKGTKAAASVAALVKGTLKLMAWMKFKFAAGWSAAFLAAGAAGVVVWEGDNTPPKNPALARQILLAAFGRVSAPVPAQMRFVAEVEEVERPWTEAQVLAEVQRTEDDEKKRFAQIPGLREQDFARLPPAAQARRQSEQAGLREIRLESIRWAHGTRTHLEQEWFSGGFGGSWRLDQTETTSKPDSLRALDPALPPGVVYEQTMMNVGDTNLAGQTPNLIDRRLRAAQFGAVNWEKSALWEAATLEPQVGFLLTMSVGNIWQVAALAKTKSKSEQSIDSFAGVKLDAGKLDALAAGRSRLWHVETDEAVLDGRKMAVLRLKGKAISLARGVEVAFFADAGNVTHIHRIELTGMPFMKSPYTSIRDDFDTNGFPHTWIVESPNDDYTLKRTVKFKEVDFHATFDDKSVFTPEIPADYSSNGRARN